jgi:hypothetical protein
MATEIIEEPYAMPAPARARRSVARVQGSKPETPQAVRYVGDNLTDVIDRSLARRPYTTLLMAVGLGFVLGAVWAR